MYCMLLWAKAYSPYKCLVLAFRATKGLASISFKRSTLDLFPISPAKQWCLGLPPPWKKCHPRWFSRVAPWWRNELPNHFRSSDSFSTSRNISGCICFRNLSTSLMPLSNPWTFLLLFVWTLTCFIRFFLCWKMLCSPWKLCFAAMMYSQFLDKLTCTSHYTKSFIKQNKRKCNENVNERLWFHNMHEDSFSIDGAGSSTSAGRQYSAAFYQQDEVQRVSLCPRAHNASPPEQIAASSFINNEIWIWRGGISEQCKIMNSIWHVACSWYSYLELQVQ